METMVMRLKGLQQLARKAGPYLLLEILLPGGTLFALLLFLYQRRHGRFATRSARGNTIVVAYAIGRVRDAMLVTPGRRVAAMLHRGGAGESDGLEPLAMAPAR